MKLHKSVLLTLAASAGVGVTVADVTWTNETFDYSTLSPTFPTDGGAIHKTGSGTVYLAPAGGTGNDSSFDFSADSTVGGSASEYAGDVYIDGGTLRFGSTGTTNFQSGYRVSPDALGTEGTIYVASGASLTLGITQSSTVTFSKAVSLNGGNITFADGHYTFSKALSLTADSTIQGDWSGKRQSFAGLNAEGQKLTIEGGAHTYTFTGGVTAKTIDNKTASTLKVDTGATVANVKVDTINLKGGSKLAFVRAKFTAATANTTGEIIIDGSATDTTIIAGGMYGNNSYINHDISGTGTLELQTIDLINGRNKVALNGEISGDLKLVLSSGHFELNHTNAYTGGTLVKANGTGINGWSNYDHLSVLADGALGSGDVTVVGLGKVEVAVGKNQTNKVNFKSDDTTTEATLTGATWEGTTLTGTSATGGSITGGTLNVSGTFSVTDVAVTGSTLNVANGGNLTMTGALDTTSSVAVAGGGTLDLSGATLAQSNVLELKNLTLADNGVLTLAEGVDTLKVTDTLDLSDMTVLTVQNLFIADGATVILGEGTRIHLSGSLTVGENVSFDVSDWCAYDEFIPYELFTYTGTGTLSATLPENVTIVTSTKDNPKGWLAVEGNGVMLIPEPTTTTLSLLALAGLAARRRRR